MGRKEDFLTNDYATENVVLDMAGTYTVISHNGYNNTHPGLHSKSSNCSSSSSGSAQEEKRWRKYCGILGLFLSLALSITVCCIMWGSNAFSETIDKNLILSNSSLRFETWAKPPVKPLLRLYILNYTNVYEFETGIDSKLKVEELGPYTYIQSLERVNIVYHGNGTITYQDRKLYHFSPQFSSGTEDDKIIVPNMPFWGAVSLLKNLEFFPRVGLAAILNGLKSRPFISLPVGDFLWGYDDHLSNLASKVMGFKYTIPFIKFGLLASKNGTQPDNITVYTGEKDTPRTGIVYSMNEEISLKHWGSDECNRIDGTDGSIYSPSVINPNSTLYLYTKDLCRRIPLEYDTTYNDKHDIPVLKFRISRNAFTSGKVYSNNMCFCSDPQDPESCLPSGVFNVSACAYDAPVMTSLPHFLYGDSILYENIEGLNPDVEKHEPFVEVNPVLGVPVGGKSRLQLNIMVSQQPAVAAISSYYPDGLILPVAWMDFGFDKLPDDLSKLIKTNLFMIHATKIFLSYGSIIAIAATLLLVIKRVVRRADNHFRERNIKMSSTNVPLVTQGKK